MLKTEIPTHAMMLVTYTVTVINNVELLAKLELLFARWEAGVSSFPGPTQDGAETIFLYIALVQI
jgi:hypothetical protein